MFQYKMVYNVSGLNLNFVASSFSVEEWLHQNRKFTSLMSILDRKENMIAKVLRQLEIMNREMKIHS